MSSLTRRFGVAVMLGSAVLVFAAPRVGAQSPIVRPGLTPLQYAATIATVGQALSNGSPFPTVIPNSGRFGGSLNASMFANPYTAGTGYGNDPYSNPYYPYYSYTDPGAAALYGASTVINAQGQFMVNQQQAYLMREQVRAERIANRRRELDEYLYYREKAPTTEDDRQRFLKEQLVRSRNNPPVTEVWSGKALNDLLADLRKNSGKGETASLRTFPIPLDEEGLKHINVTTTEGKGNIGLLKNEGRLTWPAALSGSNFKDLQDRIEALARDAVKMAGFNNQVDAGITRQMNDDVSRLRKQLRMNGNDLAPAQYIEAKNFLDNLDAAITALQQRDVGNYFNGKYALKAKNVGELVKLMADRGLQFAPALPGDESAYLALQQALANYDIANKSDIADR